MNDIEKTIIASIENNNFFETVHQAHFDIKKNHDVTLGETLSYLHNSGQLNLLEEFLRLKNEAGKVDFFSLRHVFSKALPQLSAPVLEVMKTVRHLTIQAEGDMTQGLLIGPFIEYCKNTPSRINEVLSISLESVDENFDFVSPALIAGSELDLQYYFEIACELIRNEGIQPEILRRAIFSLGRMNFTESSQPGSAFLTILKRLPDLDSQSFSVCLKALFNIYLQDLSLDKDFLNFLLSSSNRFDDLAIHNVSELLYFNDEELSDVIESQLLEIVSKVKSKNMGTIDNIDWALKKLFEMGRSESAIKCFENICINPEHKISIQKFDSFSQKLIENPNQILSKTVTKWFLSRNILLCRQTFELLQNPYFDKNIEIDCDLLQVKNGEDLNYLFLARKAIGWFYIRPISAISFVISMIDTCSKSELAEIEELCFDPLLISYPGSVKAYLEAKAKNSNKRVKAFCKRLLSRLKVYHDGLKSTQGIKELKPSEQDRYAYNRHNQRQMNESMKAVKSSSLLTALGVHESVLLYGNKSISYIYNGPDDKVRQEIPLRQISTSVEFPSLQILNPHHLDWTLRIFRLEGCQ